MTEIRWGLLGCGDIARKRVADALNRTPGSRLVAACRRDAGKLREFCDRFAVPRGYTSDSALLADPEVDAVYVATPVNLHRPQTLAAAAAGKHVLVEKPMALDAAECDDMIAACARAGVLLGVAYYRRFYPVVARIKEIIQSGEIGRPMSVAAVTSTPLDVPPGGEGYWRVVPGEGGGGALMDVGSHRLDLFADMFGEVGQVKALCGVLAGDYEGEDCASLVLRFRSGVHGALQCFFRTRVTADEFVVTGTDGRLTASPLNGDRLHVDLGDSGRVESHPPAANLHAPLVADFVAAVREQRQPVVSGAEGRKASAIMDMAYRDPGARPAR